MWLKRRFRELDADVGGLLTNIGLYHILPSSFRFRELDADVGG